MCGQVLSPSQTAETCPSCGEKGILDIEYDYEAMGKVVDLKYFQDNQDFSMWRYQPLMSVESDDFKKMLHVGWTPLYKAARLNQEINVKTLYIKDEGLNPSASLKDRASAVAVLKASEAKHSVISCSSTGNAASSLACHAARMGLKSVIFVPKRAPLGKVTQLMVYGTTLISVDGDYRQTFNLSKQAIEAYGWYNRNAAINPHLVEGKKTVALEIAEQLDFQPTDWVAVSVGDGCTIAGVYKGFYDLLMLGLIKKMPRLLGVQSEGCDPFCQAWITKSPLLECEENTIADSIAVGIPRNPIKAQKAVANSDGAWIAVADADILNAMKQLGSREGIFGEPAGVAALAGIKKAVKDGIIQPTETVTFIMTGNGLKDPENARKAVGAPPLLKPDLLALQKYLQEKGEFKHV